DINCLQSKRASSGGMTEAIKSRDGDFQFQRGPLSQSEPRRVRWPYMNRLFYKGKMLHGVRPP
ncbi:MAG: hypothetical protein J0H65_00125, partial [Rhizobiales bacterium]|nr:hypothetical protein [Hyphomicrobiales bacterium]